MVDLFISYSRANQDAVRLLADAVRQMGYSVWWDDELPPHRSYGDVITEKIGEAKATIVVWSETAAQSEWVRAEADVGRNQKKLIQTSLDRAQPPMPFNQIQCAYLGDWQGEADHRGWTKVQGSILALCGPPEKPADTAPDATPETLAAASVSTMAGADGDADPDASGDSVYGAGSPGLRIGLALVLLAIVGVALYFALSNRAAVPDAPDRQRDR